MSKYVIVDLEMCKIKQNIGKPAYSIKNELIEIGAVILDESLEITDRFKTYVSPELGAIDSYIEELTGITKEDTKDAPNAKEALEMFANWIPDNAVLVSWSESDETQIRKETEYKNIEIPRLFSFMENWIDCQKIFSEKMNSPKTYRLSEALSITGIEYDENLHDGLSDAYNTALLYAKMLREPKLKLVPWYNTHDEENDDDSDDNCPFAELLKDFKCAN